VPSLGLSIIVKTGAETLGPCIASVCPLAEQVVVLDTGSTDGTPEIARAAGAEVYQIEWLHHFAEARNRALEPMRTDWVLVLDDDEELDGEALRVLPELMQNTRIAGYFAPIRTYLPNRFGGGAYSMQTKPNDSLHSRALGALAYVDIELCRLFRRNPAIRFQGRVHEVIHPSIARAGLKVAAADFLIHHFGNLSAEIEHRKKDEYYRKLARLKTDDEPENPQAWIELGIEEFERFKQYTSAITCFKTAMRLKDCSPVAYTSLTKLYLEIGDDTAALQLLNGVRMSGNNAAEKEHICGDAFYNLGRLKEARAAYARALKALPHDSRIESKLGLTEVRLGMKTIGFAKLERALASSPQVLEMHDRMIKACIAGDMMEEAAQAAERVCAGLKHPKTFLRAASIRAQLKQTEDALRLISEGLKHFPEDTDLLRAQEELSLKQKGQG
jgi:glycosyltransferase involved in cell wall biosynthesis